MSTMSFASWFASRMRAWADRAAYPAASRAPVDRKNPKARGQNFERCTTDSCVRPRSALSRLRNAMRRRLVRFRHEPQPRFNRWRRATCSDSERPFLLWQRLRWRHKMSRFRRCRTTNVLRLPAKAITPASASVPATSSSLPDFCLKDFKSDLSLGCRPRRKCCRGVDVGADRFRALLWLFG
jgi:hypothetical protein